MAEFLDIPVYDDRVGELAKALNHRLRRAILRAMADGKPTSASDLVPIVDASLSDVGYHMKVLRDNHAVVHVKTLGNGSAPEYLYQFAIEDDWALTALGLKAARRRSIGATDPPEISASHEGRDPLEWPCDRIYPLFNANTRCERKY